MRRGVSLPDPFQLNPVPFTYGGAVSGALWNGNQPYTFAGDRTVRGLTINPAIRNLVVIVAGQSLRTSQIPTDFTLTNASAIDNFSIYDGAVYAYKHPLVGCTYVGNANGGGPGFTWGKVADLFISNGIFDRVIIVPIAVAGSAIADWATGYLSNRIGVAITRLKARGIVPGTNVTLAIEFGEGESDNQGGTTQANYLSMQNAVVANAFNAGFSGRFFVAQESWIQGVTSSAITNAQAAAVNGTTVFSSGNLDALGASFRDIQSTHFNDSGGAAAASIIYSAMHASGSPY